MGQALAPAAEALHKIKHLRYFNLLARNGSRPGREARICLISLCALPQLFPEHTNRSFELLVTVPDPPYSRDITMV